MSRTGKFNAKATQLVGTVQVTWYCQMALNPTSNWPICQRHVRYTGQVNPANYVLSTHVFIWHLPTVLHIFAHVCFPEAGI